MEEWVWWTSIFSSMNIISTNITTYPLGCSCQIFFEMFLCWSHRLCRFDTHFCASILAALSCQAKLPPAGHISAEELEQEHRLQWLDSLIKEEEKADFPMNFVHGMSPKLGDFTKKYDQSESNWIVMDGIPTSISANLGIWERTHWDCIGHFDSSDNFVTLKRQGSFIVQIFAFDHQTWGT